MIAVTEDGMEWGCCCCHWRPPTARAPCSSPAGELPGVNGSFATLTRLAAAGNALTGTIPDAWAYTGIFAVANRTEKQVSAGGQLKKREGCWPVTTC